MASIGSFLWIAALGALFYYMMNKGGGCCGGGHNHKDQSHDDHKEHEGNNDHATHHEQLEKQTSEIIELRDPVCGMEVPKSPTSLISDHFGRTFHFCSEQCRKLFEINPNKYIGTL